MNLTEVLKLKAGVNGIEVEGKLTKIFKPEDKQIKSGARAGETFKVQNMYLEGDGQGVYVSQTGTFIDVQSFLDKGVILDDVKIVEYRNKKGETVKSLQSKGNVRDMSIKVEPTSNESKPVGSVPSPVTTQKPTDWLAKELRDIRKTMWDSTLMTLYPILSQRVSGEMNEYMKLIDILKEVKEATEYGFDYVYSPLEEEISKEGEENVPF
jgi:hypothetical protein